MTLTPTQMYLLGTGAIVALLVAAYYLSRAAVQVKRDTDQAVKDAAWSPRKARITSIVGYGWGTVVGIVLLYYFFKWLFQYFLPWLAGRS